MKTDKAGGHREKRAKSLLGFLAFLTAVLLLFGFLFVLTVRPSIIFPGLVKLNVRFASWVDVPLQVSYQIDGIAHESLSLAAQTRVGIETDFERRTSHEITVWTDSHPAKTVISRAGVDICFEFWIDQSVTYSYVDCTE